ncbi:cell division protein ZapD [Thioalkalicoccus limnaeus]|uniref:Cell division protein ZapD n=1 Tax=Thioalkalicoccus limnaeus TaxID=120681 RepID=A0ABV4BFS5_9GAMM
MSSQIVYEHPLNERTRTLLRLEHLFAKTQHFMGGDDPWDTRGAIEALLDIVAISARADVRNELLKELDRLIATLNRVRHQPGVHKGTLDRILADLGDVTSRLHDRASQLGQRAREDSLLKSVAQRVAIPGGTCGFDLPLYHRWLSQPAAARRQALADWMADLHPASDAIELILSLTRTSAAPRPMTAPLGFFQEALDPQAPAQMVRVGLDGDGILYPEISGHKNRFSIRFMEAPAGEKPVQCRDEVAFTLACCVF